MIRRILSILAWSKLTLRKPRDLTCPTRRNILRGVACGLLGGFPIAKALATPAPRLPRTLSFRHTHTGEALSTCYFDGSTYVPGALGQLNHLMRDFRNDAVMDMDAGLFDLLWDLRAAADRDATFEIISAYRSPATNAMLHRRSSGVAEHSQHLLGKAIDIRLRGFSTSRLAELARGLKRGGVGYYARSDFVHVDTGRVRYW